MHEAERGISRFELCRALEKADDFAVLGVSRHSVPKPGHKIRCRALDDRVQPLADGAIRCRHRGKSRAHQAFPGRVLRAGARRCLFCALRGILFCGSDTLLHCSLYRERVNGRHQGNARGGRSNSSRPNGSRSRTRRYTDGLLKKCDGVRLTLLLKSASICEICGCIPPALATRRWHDRGASGDLPVSFWPSSAPTMPDNTSSPGSGRRSCSLPRRASSR